MIEIALCLAIIGFALVAIIGVLPTGMGVQRENREETIINQDATVWMDAIRNGAQGCDDLTNYVVSITNFWTIYEVNGGTTNANSSGIVGYYPNLGTFQLTNGARIIGLLSTPKYFPRAPLPNEDLTFQSNYVVAYVRAISGSAVEKFPQRNQDVLDMAFQYRMIVENTALPVVFSGTNSLALWNNFQENSRELRLTFRWPVIRDATGNGRQSFRTFIGGQAVTNIDAGQLLFFFQPSTFVAR